MRFGKFAGQLTMGAVLALAGCASTDEAPPPQDAKRVEAPAAKAPPPQRKTLSNAATLDAYKKAVAQRIYDTSGSTFSGSLPPILKSVVVLNVTLDEEGRATNVAVRRSNGFKHLERVAIDAVRKADPFPEPSANVLAGGKSITYLETFLFRDDGKFQIRSLVKEPQPGAEALAKR